jgi:hypothetical protein
MTGEPNPKIKAALLLAARRQLELQDALGDLEDVLKEVAPNAPFPGEVFTLNDKLDNILMDLADKYKVDVPDSLDDETPRT